MRGSWLSPLFLLVLTFSPVFAEPSGARGKCPARCDVSKCPSPSCPSGYVPDHCNCCLICAAGEGDSCGRKEDPPCGDSLDCRYPMGKRFAKGVCQCKLSYQVCGSDGRTYDNVCQLKAVSRKALQQGLPAVIQIQKGACESGKTMQGTPMLNTALSARPPWVMSASQSAPARRLGLKEECMCECEAFNCIMYMSCQVKDTFTIQVILEG